MNTPHHPQRETAFAAALAAESSACSPAAATGNLRPAAHGAVSAAEDHRDQESGEKLTHFTDTTELFVELPAA
jgi:hypothetical protein